MYVVGIFILHNKKDKEAEQFLVQLFARLRMEKLEEGEEEQVFNTLLDLICDVADESSAYKATVEWYGDTTL